MKKKLSLVVVLVLSCVLTIAGTIPVSAAPTVYEDPVDVYEYSIGGTITWGHTYDGSAFPVSSATLTIVADDVDGPGNGLNGEQDAVWVNGTYLGDLVQLPGYTDFNYFPGPGNPVQDLTTTVFDVTALLNTSMACEVVVEALWGVEIETSTLTVEQAEVDIDIKPWSDPNSVNRKQHGVIPVGILGSSLLDVNVLYGASYEFLGATSTAHDLSDPLVFADHIVNPYLHDPDGVPASGDEFMATANMDLIPDLVIHFNEDDLTDGVYLGADRNDPVPASLTITLANGVVIVTEVDIIRIVK